MDRSTCRWAVVPPAPRSPSSPPPRCDGVPGRERVGGAGQPPQPVVLVHEPVHGGEETRPAAKRAHDGRHEVDVVVLGYGLVLAPAARMAHPVAVGLAVEVALTGMDVPHQTTAGAGAAFSSGVTNPGQFRPGTNTNGIGFAFAQSAHTSLGP